MKTGMLTLFTLLCAAIANVQGIHAATITITNLSDSGSGTLRQALVDANDGDTIQFVSDRPTGIQLTSGELLVNKSVTITATSAPLPVFRSQAPGIPAFRIFHIAPSKNVSISRLYISNGATTASGGGVYNDQAALTLTGCRISGNSSSGTVGFQGGGGIYNNDASLTINNCLISNNSAAGDGGGIFNYADYRADVQMTINSSTVSGNSASEGGGIASRVDGRDQRGRTSIDINNCTISGNSAGDGGGIAHVNGFGDSTQLVIQNSTLSGNSARGAGGGIYNASNIWSRSQQIAIYYSTLSGNVAPSLGGGIYNGASAEVRDTFIGNNILKTGNSGPNIFNNGGTITDYGYNLSSDNGGGVLTGPGDQINTDPMIGPLQNNGGPTLTHAPLTGSPAINTGFPEFSPPPYYDQRGAGYARVVNGRIDIGAVEVQAPPPRPTPTPRPEPTRPAPQ